MSVLLLLCVLSQCHLTLVICLSRIYVLSKQETATVQRKRWTYRRRGRAVIYLVVCSSVGMSSLFYYLLCILCLWQRFTRDLTQQRILFHVCMCLYNFIALDCFNCAVFI